MTNESAPSIAVFCDYENVAIGVKDAKYSGFDIQLVLGRLLEKGQVVVKKAYADWDRYKSERRALHESAFELIEIPHVSYSGKNSADIRLVVDALDLCYTKPHVRVFAIVSGDSDFSPLVSKLRENAKQVIGLGVKNSTSDLLVENCDEFIYYDDLVRDVSGEKRKARRGKRSSKKSKSDVQESPEEKKKDKALDLVLQTAEALLRDRGEPVWGSMVKQTLKRKQPNFSETFHGYRSFTELLEEAERRGALEMRKDEPSGGYVITAVLD